MRKKYNFERDVNNCPINPDTGVAFKYMEPYGTKVFRYFDIKHNRIAFSSIEDINRWKKITKDIATRDYTGPTRNIPSVARLKVNSAKTRCKTNKRGGKVDPGLLEKTIRVITAGVCEVTAIPFHIPANGKGKTSQYSPSLDRINNDDPNYSLENTQVVLNFVNRAKGDATDEEMKHIVPIWARSLVSRTDMGVQTD
jgi:hypothetical protein